MIRHFEVQGLNNQIDVSLHFQEDLNILTGKNGSGKTSVMKLLWYVVSGHFEHALTEIAFDSLAVTADAFQLRAWKSDESSGALTVAWDIGAGWTKKTITRDRFSRPVLHNVTTHLAYFAESTLFFPTFRRIEGGFSPSEQTLGKIFLRAGRSSGMQRLQDAMQELSASLSNGSHQFIASISTHDIVDLLTREYADVSERVNGLHEELSSSITSQIAAYSEEGLESDHLLLQRANSILQAIELEVSRISAERESTFQPFSVLSSLIGDVFQYRGIQVTDAVTLGETGEAISSDKLSAGEKQMLSFLCYNAFTRNATIFIDEPELSLHADWQRRLFPTLLSQATGNQFIVATHSPFIYSKFPEKELMLDIDRGDEWAGVVPDGVG